MSFSADLKMKNPLVSIIVVAYNSADTIIETLESIRNQTYKNIELIISDDASVDNTVELANEWLKENKSGFKHTRLIDYKNNTGLPANCNRGIRVAKGEWIKIIAADDLLYPDCIESNIQYASENTESELIFSKISRFGSNSDNSGLQIEYPYGKYKLFFEKDVSTQQKMLLTFNSLNAPSACIKKSVFDAIGLFDEYYHFMEDYPFWIKASRRNYKFHFIDKATVKYRMNESISVSSKNWANELFLKEKHDFFKKEIASELKTLYYPVYLQRKLNFVRLFSLINLFGNKRTVAARIWNKLIHHFNVILVWIFTVLYRKNSVIKVD